MPPDSETRRPFSIGDFARSKADRRKLTMLTAYDYTSARWLDAAGVDCLLVGDSLGTAVQGRSTTLSVTLAQMVYHAEMVARGATRAFVVADLPFLSYQVSPSRAIQAAGTMLKRTECGAVKLEGGRSIAATLRSIVEAGIPVMGHVGLMPQSVRRLGGYKIQRDEAKIVADAHAIAEAGAFAVVLECVPTPIADRITAELSIPTFGIGAGPGCDGQVLVTPDLLGLTIDFRPRFARRYAELGSQTEAAVRSYIEDVRSGRFPTEAESFA